jgi:hypothetical protein
MANPYSTLGTNPYNSLPASPYNATQTSTPPVPASMGTRAVSPTTTVTKPPTTLPKAQAVTPPASAGTYKGVNITHGSDADVAAQIAKINANQPDQAPAQTPSYPGLIGAQIQAKDQAAAPAAPPAPPTYSGLIGSAAGQAGNVQTQAGNVNNTATQIGANGQMSPQELAKIQLLGGLTESQAQDSANIETHPGVGGFAMGRDAINLANHEAIRSSLGQQIQGYAASRTANANALNQQATQQNNAGTLMGNAGNLYQNAATSAAPSTATPGQAVFNPLTGTYSSASSGGGTPTTAPSGIDQNSWNQYIQAYASGNIASIPSAITGNANLAGQLQAAVQAQNPNYDYATATGAAGARNSNAGLAGTTSPEAYKAIYTKALSDYADLQQSIQNVDGFGTLLTSNMSAGGINPTDVKYANQTLAQIRGQLSSSAQGQYDSTLAALRSKISGMLAVGGSETPTAITADAQKILDGSLPLSSLNAVLSRIQTEGNTLLTNQGTKVNAAKTGTLGGNGGGGGSTAPITWNSIISH